MKAIEMVAPREDVGRDTVSRFDMQYQAAAYAALEILKGNGVDCVYCDYHDDFVVRKNVDGRVCYHFFQVKTKRKENHQWSLAEIFSVTKARQKTDLLSLAKVKSSFAGKLLIHGIVFGENCTDVTLLSNVYFDDDVVTTVEELRGKTPKSKAAKFLSDNFLAIFSIEESDSIDVAEALGKISLLPAVRYIGEGREAFTNEARSAVFHYSEIDLTFDETKDLASGLVDLVFRKSRTKLSDVAPENISTCAGVQLDDLLGVLSISKASYEALLAGEEPKALKTASVIQRWYKKAGANEQMIDYAAQQKVNWDLWLRTARHIYLPLDLNILLQRMDDLFESWQVAGADFKILSTMIENFFSEPEVRKFDSLSKEAIFGGMNAVLVRKYSQ